MAASNWSATAASSVIVAADDNRLYLTIQLLAGDPMSIGVGETATYGKGVTLVEVGDCVKIRGGAAKLAISGVCDTGNSATGGYQSGSDITFIPGAPS